MSNYNFFFQIHFGGNAGSNPDKTFVPSNPTHANPTHGNPTHVVAEALDRFFPLRYRDSEDRESLENRCIFENVKFKIFQYSGDLGRYAELLIKVSTNFSIIFESKMC